MVVEFLVIAEKISKVPLEESALDVYTENIEQVYNESASISLLKELYGANRIICCW